MQDPAPVARRHGRRSRGQSLVEFALVLPLLFAMFAAVLDLGRVFYATITLNNAAREGALQASETPHSFVQGAACDEATNLVVCRVQHETRGSMVAISPADIDMTCSITGCPDQAGSRVTVAISGEFQLLTPLLSFVFGGQTLDLGVDATAQVLYVPESTIASAPPAPLADFTFVLPDPSEAPATVMFIDQSTAPTEWAWDFGDGSPIVNDQNPTHVYEADGEYLVKLTAINLTTADIEQKLVVIGTPPEVTDDPPAPLSCFPPDVVGESPTAAQLLLSQNGWTWTTAIIHSGPKDQVQAQNPDHTVCVEDPAPRNVHFVYRPGSG